MGVRTGLSFYTSAAQPATPPYLGSLQSFTPENSGLEKSRIEGGVKICLEFMRWDITSGFQLLRGGRWMVWQQQAWWQLSMYAPGERPSFRSNTGFRNCRSGKRWKYSSQPMTNILHKLREMFCYVQISNEPLSEEEQLFH